MRMRKLPWAEEFLAEAEVVVKKPQDNAGKWKQLLACETLHVEVGTGKGDYWIQMAQQYADEGWIGIEKNSSVAALAVRKYTKLENSGKNMLYIQNDAESIQSWFAEGEVDVLHLNFPILGLKNAHIRNVCPIENLSNNTHISLMKTEKFK